MKLRRGNLSLRMQGEVVKLLQEELRKIGFSIVDKEGFYGKSTRLAIMEFQRLRELETTGVVDEATANLINKEIESLQSEPEPGDKTELFIVRGQIRQANGKPFVGALVRAFDKDLRKQQKLDESSTDEEGRYTISYSKERFERAEKGSADLFIVVFDADEQELARSDVVFNALQEETVDLTVLSSEPELCEFDYVRKEIQPLLEGQGDSGDNLTIYQLSDSDITFLANDTGIARERIAWFVQAAKLALETTDSDVGLTSMRTHVAMTPHSAIPNFPSEVFYAWFRQGLPTDRNELLNRSSGALIDTLKKSIEGNIVPANLAEQLDGIRGILDYTKAQNLLQAAPQGMPASLGDAIQMLADEEALSPDQARQFVLLQADKAPGEDLWEKVASAGLSAVQVAGLQRLFVLNRIVEGDQSLLREAKFRLPRVSDGDEQSPLLSIAALDVNDWHGVLKAARPPTTDDTTLADEAQVLTRRVAELMPTEFLLVRALRQPKADLLNGQLSHLTKLQELNGREIIGKPLEDLKIEGISSDEREVLRLAFRELNKIVNYYPGLQLQEILTRDGAIAEKVTEIQKRVSLVEKLFMQNVNTNFLALDYMPDSIDLKALKFEGFEEQDKKMVLRTMKAYQRVNNVTSDALQAKELLEAGFHSGTAIAGLTLEAFAQTTGLNVDEAYAVHEAAKDRATDAGIQFMAVYDYVRPLGQGGKHPVNSVSAPTDVGNYLRRLEGFDVMFGKQTTCKCKHCQSVFSAAAYFVDLMRFIDENVTKQVFVGSQAAHALKLKNRRPDLWTLELTCENTNTLIAYLDIINEVLENFIAQDLTSRPTTRAEIQKRVYRKLKDAQESFQQPFVLPLLRIEAYLSHFERTRADVARALGVDEATYTRARLRLSLKELDLTTQPRDTNQTFLEGVFGKPITDSLTPTKEIDVQTLLVLTRWTRADLGQLFATKFVSAGGTIAIRPKKSSPDSIQNDIEVVSGLSFGVLDRLHRFTRLWRKLPWSIAELDLVLSVLKTGTSPSLVTELSQIAKLLDIQQRFVIPVEHLCALFTTIPTIALERQRSLFDRLFNLEPFVTQDGVWPQNQQFTHPSQGGGASQPDNKALQRLLAGLQVSDQELVQLIEGLAFAQPFPLNIDNLTLLYRHARVSRLLKVTVPELFQLMALGKIGSTAAGHRLTTVDNLQKLLEIFNEWKASAFILDDLGFMTGGSVLKPDTYPKAETIAKEIADSVRRERALEFADTVFSQLPTITEAQSRALINANTTVLEKVANTESWRLKNSFDPKSGTLIIPPVVDNSRLQEIRDLLSKFHPRGILPSRIASKLGISEEKILSISALVGNILDTHDANLVSELQANGQTPLLQALVQKFLPLAVLFRNIAWEKSPLEVLAAKPSSLEFLTANPGVFSLSLPLTPNQLQLDAVFKIAAYVRMATVADQEFTPEKAQANAEAVRTVLRDGFADNSLVAKALRATREQVAALKPHLTLPAAEPFEAFRRLGDCLNLSNYLGVSGETLKLIVPITTNIDAEHGDLVQAAEGVYGVIRAKYPEEKTFLEKIEPYEDKIRSLKRDGLVEYLIHSAKKGFKSSSALYQYFLIDTQLEGCARTSRVVAANSSLQLYVHRILMNLEQSSEIDPNPVHVTPDRILSEWAWRKNYRVWEANRKVYLYPESYLEPELRDDKTPLFEELESTLLQQTINEQNVTGGYAKYLAGFEEVAKLKIAGAYHDKDTVTREDTLHLFGATSSDPPIYYYRTIENLYFSAVGSQQRKRMRSTPWRRLNVQIPTRTISPIPFRGTLYLFWAEINSQSSSSFVNGTSQKGDYIHKITMRHSELKLDGSWTSPQAIVNPRYEHATFTLATPPSQQRLGGFHWERVYPALVPSSDGKGKSTLYLIGMGSGGEAFQTYGSYLLREVFDPTTNKGLLSTERIEGLSRSGTSIYYAEGAVLGFGQRAATTMRYYQLAELLNSPAAATTTELVKFTTGPDIEMLNGSYADCIVDVRGDVLLLYRVDLSAPFVLRRLGTTVAEDVAISFMGEGLGRLLSLEFQERLEEASPLLDRVDQCVIDAIYDPSRKYTLGDGTVVNRPIDFSGLFGVYFREIFFHIPFLIANHLNSQQRFSASQRWYHYLFDPTSPDTDGERVWRYREFRGRKPETLREILTEPGALELYRGDPFNPHAIARLRLGAYQKAIVMKYIDNLLDWGDTLFAEFTMESVNEATMLYVMAADILGPRPPEIGDCGESTIITYQRIEEEYLLSNIPDFLIELEHLSTSKVPLVRNVIEKDWDQEGPAIAMYAPRSSATMGAAFMDQPPEGLFQPDTMHETETSYWRTTGGTDLRTVGSYGSGAEVQGRAQRRRDIDDAQSGRRISVQGDPINPPATDILGAGGNIPVPGGLVPYDYKLPDKLKRQPGLKRPDHKKPIERGEKFPSFEVVQDVATSSPVFCVPENSDLRAYWDRVENRLYKIRNCMDITGARRQLSLFAPEIDPRLLVRARAAGLSLEDVLNVTRGNVPPYRFIFLIEKGKQYASTVQGLGSALLSALEKKDAEELNRLRTVHEQNLLKLRKRVQELEIEAAEDTLASLERQRDTVEFRKNYYESLVQTGLLPWERTQQISRHTASGLHGVEAILGYLAGTLALVPQVGAPTAMKYGGVEVSNSAGRFAHAIQALAQVSEAISASAGLEATFQRRDEEWEHQKNLAEKEIANLDKQIEAADIRLEIARRSKEVHEATIKQAEEVFEFYRDKFSNLGLYTVLSTRLHRLYRESFNAAFAMAKMAEQAYLFERDTDKATLLSNTYWDASQAGLLAGERLLLDLENLERRYLETNYRTLEVEQSFSLMQFAPNELLKLRQTGECSFSIPEIFFDLTYPGHYRRRIKAVRLTIPCVVGPYMNVGATLRLKSSEIRGTPGVATLDPVPLRHTTTIATSTAQNDAGVFEFNFRDERYIPFEGAGAISKWQLVLPKNFRTFDYQTIADVILRINYTAEEDGGFRTTVENQISTLLSDFATSNGLFRLFSARHEFPSEWHKFLHPKDTDEKQTLQLKLTAERFPFLFKSKILTITQVELFLKLKDEKDSGTMRTYNDLYVAGGGVGRLKFMLTPPGPATDPANRPRLEPNGNFGGIPHAVITVTTGLPVTFEFETTDADIASIAAELRYTVTAEEETHRRLKAEAIEDLIIVCHYSVTG